MEKDGLAKSSDNALEKAGFVSQNLTKTSANVITPSKKEEITEFPENTEKTKVLNSEED